ncbi:hypothetical protein [endosymbiont of Riftia pachyptila]|uniref:hypothetical protein n=1 Tax=endosymbiont of Riftia pachyptila TaxID=54396 RepID=UPI000586916E|nr:hypothetical protein [endosymbiont of Riftia pachyptila]
MTEVEKIVGQELARKLADQYGDRFARLIQTHLIPSEEQSNNAQAVSVGHAIIKKSRPKITVKKKKKRFWSVREAKNDLSVLLSKARGGEMQLIQKMRSDEDEPVIVISFSELSELIEAASSKSTVADMFPIDEENPSVDLTDLELTMGTPSKNLLEL